MNYRACFLIIGALLISSHAAHAAFPEDLKGGVSLESTGVDSGIQNFPVTAKLVASVTSEPISSYGRGIILNSNKASVWRNGRGPVAAVNANAWLFAKFGDNWHGATWEFIRKGQTVKSEAALVPNHFKNAPPWNNFRPRDGEYYGFMTSGITRNGPSQLNVSERSNISWWQWGVGPVDESEVFGGRSSDATILAPIRDFLLQEPAVEVGPAAKD